MIEWATMAEVARLFGWSESYARKLAHRDGITQPEGVDVDRPTVGSVQILRGNALALALADESVDLIVTSPPYFGLRSYQDGGEHYAGQIGDEPTPAEFVDALIAATAEMVRVLKPSGSIWVNLGDKYSSTSTPGPQSANSTMTGGRHKGVENIEHRRLTSGDRATLVIGHLKKLRPSC